MKMYRLISILLKLEQGKRITAGELARELEVSKRTIFRDIEELCQSGVPITAIEGKHGGYYIEKEAAQRFSTLFEDEVEDVLLSVMGISSRKQREASEKSVYKKLRNIFSDQYAELTQTIEERFMYDDEAWWNMGEDNDYKAITRAVLSNNKLKLYNYSSTSTQGEGLTERVVRPYGLVVKNNEWYLAAFCEERNGMRTFKCSRMRRFDVLSSQFSIPADFNLREYWTSRVEEYKKEIADRLTYFVTLKARHRSVQMLLSNLSTQIEEDTYIMKYKSFEDAVKEIWLMQDGVIVIEPLELREYFRQAYENLLSFYEKET